MFLFILKKEFKSFFSSKGTLAVMVALPILLLTIFGFALGDYVDSDYNTFEDGEIFYIVDTENTETISNFHDISGQITIATNVTFIEVYDEKTAQLNVEESIAYGLITIKDGEYSYFRSTFNEPQGGELVRNLFVQLANKTTTYFPENSDSITERIVLESPQINSIGYYTFSSLAFSILFMGLLVGFSVQNEKNLGILERIQLSKAGVGTFFFIKLLAGVACGIGQILITFVFSTFLLNVDWGLYTFTIFFLFLLLSLYSSLFGGVMGFISKNKSSCQNNVLMTSMLSGYFGGSITPLYLLENTSFMNILINCSPLYWFNTASISLQNNLFDKSIFNAILVLSSLILILLCVLYLYFRKNLVKNTGKAGVS